MSMMDAIEEEYEDRIEELNKRIKELEAGQLDFAKEMIRRHKGKIHKGKIQKIKELETKLEQHRWIPVNEEIPSQVSGHWGSEIVFATDGKRAWACKYNFSAGYWTASSGDITHWKPIILPDKALKGE